MNPGIAPGGSGTFAAQPVDVNGNPDQLPAGVIPSWSVDKTVGFTITPSVDGLSAKIDVDKSVTPGSSFTITVQATLPDGTTPSGTLAVPIFQLQVTGFVITQVA